MTDIPLMLRRFTAEVRRPQLLIFAGFVLAAVHVTSLVFLRIDGHDASVHIFWIGAFREIFAYFSWWPRWSHLSFYGLGSPVFYYYPPITYLLASVIAWVGPAFSSEMLFRIVAAVAYLGSFFFMRILLRSLALDRRQVLAGSLIYAFNPYVYFTLFTRGSLSEVVSFSFMPLVFLVCALSIYDRSTWWRFLLSTLGCAAVLLSSIPSGISLLLLLGTALLILGRDWERSALGVWSLLLSCGIASVCLLPAVLHLGRLGLDNLFPTGEHSPLLETVNGGYLQTRIVIPLIFLSLAAIWFRAVQREARGQRRAGQQAAQYRFFFAAWTIGLVFQFPFVFNFLSSWILPIHMIQFPWRMDMILMLLAIVFLIQDTERNPILPRAIVLMLLSWLIVTTGIEGASMLNLRIGTHVVSSMEARGEFYSRTITIPMDSVGHRYSASANEPHFMLDSPGSVTTRYEHPNERSYEITIAHPSTATLHLYYWPEWVATVNGIRSHTEPDSIGRTRVGLPAGHSVLTIRLETSDAEIAGTNVTLASIALTCLSAIGIYFASRRRKKS